MLAWLVKKRAMLLSSIIEQKMPSNVFMKTKRNRTFAGGSPKNSAKYCP
jgi:hypothetical protein